VTGLPGTAVNSASRAGYGARLAEGWRYRGLVRNLVERDLKVRYKSSVLGILWSLINPLLMMAVFTLVFGYFMPNRAVHDFHCFVLVAILPWNWFAASVSGGVYSIVNNAHLINKIYFPREVLPVSLVLSEMVNFLLSLPVLFAILFASGIPITVHALWLPVVIAVQLVFTLGIVLFLATAHVYYRDTGMIMSVVLLAWFFLTPIIYPIEQFRTTMLPALGISAEQFMYYVNPMASLVATYRVILYGSPSGPPSEPAYNFLLRTAITALVTLVLGYVVFARHSGRFGEEV
jgi:lipopolysaccharide transport system permease protein